MTVEGARKCVNCGALVARVDARFCEFCGFELPRPERAAQAAGPANPFGDIEARFRALEADPELERALHHRPVVHVPGSFLGMLVFSGIFLAVGLGITISFALFFPPMAIFGVVVVGLGFVQLLQMARRKAAHEHGPLQRAPALVLDERTRLSSDGEGRASTTYFTTLQLRDGTRQELETLEQVAGSVVPGDLGVAYVRGGLLIAFARLHG